jgi:hypothetical protein
MQMNLGMVFKKVLDRLTLVSRKVISDDMDFFAERSNRRPSGWAKIADL